MFKVRKRMSPSIKKLEDQYEEAYEYFVSAGMIENLHGSDAYHVERLIDYIEALRLKS
jgi:hypothetical protein